MITDNIHSPADVRALAPDKLPALADEIRSLILDTVSVNGGHLSSNLGIVELTIALHRVFELPRDRVIFDVGHQCYAHKILTGRAGLFKTLRKKDGLSGFMNRTESEYDVFGSAHSSNSISAAIGMATASKLNGDDSYTIAVVGDGAFTGGMIYEALNNCVDKKLRLLIIINDNEMSISRNVGTVDNYFSRFRTSGKYFRFKNKFINFVSGLPFAGKPVYNCSREIKNKLKRIVLKENLFELLGLEYYGPMNGNDEKQLEIMFREIKEHEHGICVVHVRTKKGKGYAFAEQRPDSYHSVGCFDKATGIVPNGKELTFSYNAGKAISDLAGSDSRICAVTAAMTGGTGLDLFKKAYPDRFFDVGIAEEHAVTFCAGLAAMGRKPVFAVYSTFMQRCFDQLLEDCALQGIPVTLAIDRAGLVGDDGPTHHGLFDVSLLSQIPGSIIYSPDDIKELGKCLKLCLAYNGVSAFRYPRGKAAVYDRSIYADLGDLLYADRGTPRAAVISYGRLSAYADKAAEICRENGVDVRVIRLLKIHPLPTELILPLVKDMEYVLFAEEGIYNGSAAESFCTAFPVCHAAAVFDAFVPHGDAESLYDMLGLSPEKLAERLIKRI